MNLQRVFFFLVFLSIIYACSEDDGSVTTPTLEVEGPEIVKPDSTISLAITAVVSGLLAPDGIKGEIVSGEGNLLRTSLQGGNSVNGSATFDFTAGSMENTTTLIRISATDQTGQTGATEVEIGITSLAIKQVLVLNEGNFFSANGTIDIFDIIDGTSETSAYQATATVQQAVHYQDFIYLVTNAPDRLDVLNTDLELEQSVDQGLDNPVDFAAIGNRGFVSNWGDINTAFTDDPDSFIAIVDLENNTVIDSVMLTARPQGLLAYDNKLYIANEGGTTVSVLDPDNLSLTEVTVPAGPSDLVVDGEGMLWVLCTSGNLVEIDPDDLSLGAEISGLTTGGFNEKLAIDGTGNTIYFLGGTNNSFTGLTTVYSVNLNTQQVVAFIENGFALYGIGVNPESNEVYLGDSNAFQSTGTGFRYDAEGNKLDEFPTGIGPRGFLFK